MESLGKMIMSDTLRFERRLKGPLQRVWAYLTESELRGKWLAKGEMELFEGGKVNLQFLHRELSPEAGSPPPQYQGMEAGHSFAGIILKVNPPYLLSYTWEGGSEVTFELEEQGNEVLLTLTHRKLPADPAARISVLGGWHTHVDILIANLNGETPPNFWKRFEALQDTYREQGS